MKAYICDRCGKTYNSNKRMPTKGRILGGYISGLAFMSGDSIDAAMDFCDDCIFEFLDFCDVDKHTTTGV